MLGLWELIEDENWSTNQILKAEIPVRMNAFVIPDLAFKTVHVLLPGLTPELLGLGGQKGAGEEAHSALILFLPFSDNICLWLQLEMGYWGIQTLWPWHSSLPCSCDYSVFHGFWALLGFFFPRSTTSHACVRSLFLPGDTESFS